MISFMAVIVFAAGFLASSEAALTWQIAFCLFGACAAVGLPGGAVITPSNLFLPFLVSRAFSERYRTRYLEHVPIAGVWLGLAVMSGLLAAFYVPRFLENQIDILTIDRNGTEMGAVLMPLHPVSGNVTQSIYAISGVAAFLALRAMLEEPGRLARFRDAMLLVTALDCAAAVINFAEFYLHFPPVLTYVRTAYALFEAYESGGLMRIHGTFSEVSGFAAFTLPLFAFSFSLWQNGVRSLYSGTLAALTMLFLAISTSTTAYVGIVLYAAVLTFILTYRGYTKGTIPRIGVLITGLLLAVVLIGSLFVLDTKAGKVLTDYFDVAVFGKLESDSGVERSSWNKQCWQNFIDTWGVGVGLGSARGSSLLMVLLANLGGFGTLCFFAFLLNVLKGLGESEEIEPIREAARQSVLAALSSAVVSAAVFDLGIVFYATAAAGSIPLALRRPSFAATPPRPAVVGRDAHAHRFDRP